MEKVSRKKFISGNHPRLMDSSNILLLSGNIFFSFLYFSNGDMSTAPIENAINSVISDCQLLIDKAESKKSEFDITMEIVNLLKNGNIPITTSIFGGDAYIRKNVLHIKPSYLVEILNQKYPHRKLTVTALSKALIKTTCLIRDNSSDATKKGAEKQRYYFIDLKKLSDDTDIELNVE